MPFRAMVRMTWKVISEETAHLLRHRPINDRYTVTKDGEVLLGQNDQNMKEGQET